MFKALFPFIRRLSLALALYLVLNPPYSLAAERLTDNTVDDGNADAAIDAAGGVHVVYERAGTIFYRVRTTSGWSSEETVATGTNPAVGADANGVPQVAYLASGGVYITARTAGVWQSPVQIGSGGTVDLAVTGGGAAHVVWSGAYGGDDDYIDLMYSNNSSGSFPAEPIKLWDSWYWYDGGRSASYYSAPTIAIDGAGNFYIAYHYKWVYGGMGWTDWGTQIHVYRSATDDEVSSPD